MNDQATTTVATATPATQPAQTTPAAPVQTPAPKPVESLGVADFMSMDEAALDRLINEAANPGQPPQPAALAPAPAVAVPAPLTTPAMVPGAPSAPPMPATVNVPPLPPTDPNKALEAEIAAALANPSAPPAQPTAPPAQPAAPVAAPPEQMVADPATGKMVPLSALIAQRQETQGLKERLANLEGQLDVLKRQPAPADQPPVRTVDDELNELHTMGQKLDTNLRTQVATLAKQYDEGHITSLVQYEEKKAQLERQTSELRDRIFQRVNVLNEEKNRPNPEAVERMVLSDPYLTNATAGLTANNPWVNNLPQPTFDALYSAAINEMQSMGLPVEQTPASTWNLRNAMVEVGKRYGYDRAFAQPVATPAAGQPQQPPALVTQPNAEQRAAALVLANQQPPSMALAGVSNVNGAPDGVGSPAGMMLDGLSPQQIASMMPPEVLERMAFDKYAMPFTASARR